MSGVRADGSEEAARALDEADPLAGWRDRFCIPPGRGGGEAAYLCGNSLGLQPRDLEPVLREELDDWRRLAVDAHFEGRRPWFRYHELLREPAARLVGAHPDEVVAMNGLTVNLHLMLVSFYRPTRGRDRILMEANAFPSDTYAARSQARYHGLDPDEVVVAVGAGEADDERAVPVERFEEALERDGERVALVLLGGVNYFTGQRFELERIVRAAHARGALVGVDLAHAAGNVPLRLHDDGVDFAVWCSYKYLNAGPGSVAGCFVHRRHAIEDLPRFGGWWGNDPERRFRMHLEREFEPVAGADGWQLSNPPILATAPVLVSLRMFDEAGMEALRAKSERLTAYLADRIDEVGDPRCEVLTPAEPGRRGCQLSLRVREGGRELFERLAAAGVVADFRRPDVIRLAPVPFYNRFHDAWRAGRVLAAWSSEA